MGNAADKSGPAPNASEADADVIAAASPHAKRSLPPGLALQIMRVLHQQRRRRVAIDGTGEKTTLSKNAARRLQLLLLQFGLDALGNHANVQVAYNADQPVDDGDAGVPGRKAIELTWSLEKAFWTLAPVGYAAAD